MDQEVPPVSSGGPNGWIPVISGLVIGLLAMGLPMIGIAVNLRLGFVILGVAFILIAWGLWICGVNWPRWLRVLNICLAALIYFVLIGFQMCEQYKKEHATFLAPSSISSEPRACFINTSAV
jgi:hypothetical protein